MMKLNKRYGIVLALVLIIIVSTPLYAGDADRIGSAGAVQLLQPMGARGIAMGGADIVYTQGIDALYWNPAGLAELEKGFVGTFTRNTVFNDIGINYLGLGVRMGSMGALAFDIKSFSFGDVPLTTQRDMDGSSGATFSPTWATIGLTYSNKLTSSILVGIKAKMIHEEIPRVAGTAFAFDIGIQYRNIAGIEGVSFGVVMKNIGSSMKYDGSALNTKVTDESGATFYYKKEASSDQLPTLLEIGAAYSYVINEQNDLMVSGLYQNNNVDYDAIKFGAEYEYDRLISLRAGYIYTNNVADDYEVLYTFSIGGGIKYEFNDVLLKLDYAFRDAGIFDSNNVFSLSIGF